MLPLHWKLLLILGGILELSRWVTDYLYLWKAHVMLINVALNTFYYLME